MSDRSVTVGSGNTFVANQPEAITAVAGANLSR